MTSISAFGIPSAILAVSAIPSMIELSMLTISSWFKRAKGKKVAGGSLPRIAIIIPAHNEELLVADTVRSALGLRYEGDLQVFVIADNCTDTTAARAEAAGANVMVRSDTARRGKGHALDYAFQKLLLEPFDAFMVLDADSTISPNAALEVGSRIAAGADALQIRYEVRNVAESSHTRLVSLGFLAFNVVRPRGRAALGLSSGILGNGFALTRNTLESIPYQAFSIVEDLEYHLRLVRAGRLVQFVDTAKVLGEMPAKRADSAGQRARWEGGRLRVASTALPGLVKEIARGRWRLIEPALELLTIPLGFLVCILMAMLLIPLSAARMFAFTGLLITGTHVLTAAIAGGSPWRTLRAMATVPAYVFWKLTTLAALRRTASHEAAWIRATREEH